MAHCRFEGSAEAIVPSPVRGVRHRNNAIDATFPTAHPSAHTTTTRGAADPGSAACAPPWRVSSIWNWLVVFEGRRELAARRWLAVLVRGAEVRVELRVACEESFVGECEVPVSVRHFFLQQSEPQPHLINVRSVTARGARRARPVRVVTRVSGVSSHVVDVGHAHVHDCCPQPAQNDEKCPEEGSTRPPTRRPRGRGHPSLLMCECQWMSDSSSEGV